MLRTNTKVSVGNLPHRLVVFLICLSVYSIIISIFYFKNPVKKIRYLSVHIRSKFWNITFVTFFEVGICTLIWQKYRVVGRNFPIEVLPFSGQMEYRNAMQSVYIFHTGTLPILENMLYNLRLIFDLKRGHFRPFLIKEKIGHYQYNGNLRMLACVWEILGLIYFDLRS